MKQSWQNRKKGHINHCSPVYWEWNGASQQVSLILKYHCSSLPFPLLYTA